MDSLPIMMKIKMGNELLFVMNADGMGRRNLTEDTGLTDGFSPTWLPDGSKIAFNSMNGDIYVKLERPTG